MGFLKRMRCEPTDGVVSSAPNIAEIDPEPEVSCALNFDPLLDAKAELQAYCKPASFDSAVKKMKVEPIMSAQSNTNFNMPTL